MPIDYNWISSVNSHSVNHLLVHVFLQTGVYVLPPVEQKRFANELEPRRKDQTAVTEHCFQFFG